MNIRHINKPYVDENLKRMIKERDKFKKKCAKYPLTYTKLYKHFRNKVTDTLRKNKSNYYKTKLTDSSGNTKNTWRVIGNILNRNSSKETNDKFIKSNRPVDPVQVADGFNDYYIGVADNLANNIPHSNVSPLSFLGPPSAGRFVFSPVGEDEVVTLGGALSDVSAGCDDIPGKIIKQVIEYIKLPLTHLFNSSLTTGVFPNKLKIAQVTPIYKSGNKQLFSNYRPISVLPVISKLLEKIVHDRLQNYVSSNNIISPNQHGYTRMKSTTSAVLDLTDSILSSFDNSEHLVGVFLDLSKAFETVNHNILLQKLKHLGIHDIELEWFKNYLTERKQYVRYNDNKSETLTLSSSVPQGSVIGT